MPTREYRLVVDGELSDNLGVVFGGMTLTREHGKTVLAGPVRACPCVSLSVEDSDTSHAGLWPTLGDCPPDTGSHRRRIRDATDGTGAETTESY
jgi:hypothetical protein